MTPNRKAAEAALAKAIAERNEAFLSGNIEWAAGQLPGATSRLVVEAAFHKARLVWSACPAHLRVESINWLRTHAPPPGSLADQECRRAFGGVVVGPTLGAAFSPMHLAHGPVRSADDIAALRADDDALSRMFLRAPRHQWGAVAQAAMSYHGEVE